MKLNIAPALSASQNDALSFVLQRSKRRRRTMSISISKEGQVVVSAPLRTSRQEIERFAYSKADWVRKRLQIVAQRPKHKTLLEFVRGGRLCFLGQNLPVQVRSSKLLKRKGFCSFESGALLIEIPESSEESEISHCIEAAVRAWYYEKAMALFRQRAEFFAPQIGVQFRQLKLGQHKSQWGSCTRGGIIRLNWFIIMARLEVIDYLIVHELCHLRHMNHSEKYWKEVEKILPDYKNLRAQLREFERTFPLA